MLPNGRDFDLFDIVANVTGSLAGLGLCTWYHQRMLARRRAQRQYNAVPGDGDGDLELGEGHESGVVSGGDAEPPRTLEEEVDNWDENAMDDWDDEEGADTPAKEDGKGVESGDIGESKRSD